MKFQIEFVKRAVKDLKIFPVAIQKHILEKSLWLESHPFQFRDKIKRIKGVRFPCFRLRIDHRNDSFRLFYGVYKNVIYVLRIVSKKDADKIIRKIRRIDFPPDV